MATHPSEAWYTLNSGLGGASTAKRAICLPKVAAMPAGSICIQSSDCTCEDPTRLPFPVMERLTRPASTAAATDVPVSTSERAPGG